MTERTHILSHIGSPSRAETLARRAERSVPAYEAFLKKNGFRPGDGFAGRPLTDKAGYLRGYDYVELLAPEYKTTFFILRSSGSSGQSFFWPQLKGSPGLTGPLARPILEALFSPFDRAGARHRWRKAAFKAAQLALRLLLSEGPRPSYWWPPVGESYRYSPAFLRSLLEALFQVDRKPTLAVVGLAMGSWIGGDHFSWALKNMALDCPYPFCVFSPGNAHDEIIEMIHNAARFVEQVVLFVCPSAIAHLCLRAEQAGRPLPLENLRFVVTGEAFPETLRGSLKERSRLSEDQVQLLSIYGSADTGGLGFESPATIALRRLLMGNPALAADLGVEAPLPHFFHCNAPDAILEIVGRELCITRWQGIPLLRYNLHDDAQLFHWRGLRKALLASPLLRPEDGDLARHIETAGWNLPDLVAVRGRADSCLILCGTNITEAMLDEVVKSKDMESQFTGVYQAAIVYERERQFLSLELETRESVALDAAGLDRVYARLVRDLGRVQPEFQSDWQNIYRQWDADPERSILRLKTTGWPHLSQRQETDIKKKGILK